MGILRELQQNHPPIVVDIVRLSLWLLLLMMIFVPLERLFAIAPQKVFRKAWLTDLGYFFLNGLAVQDTAGVSHRSDRVVASSPGPGDGPSDRGRISTVGALGGGHGGGRTWLLLGPSLDA